MSARKVTAKVTPCPRMECPRCKGTGKVQVSTFADPSKQRESSCRVCNGRGTLTPDLETQNAHLAAELSALKHDIARAVQANTEALGEVERLRADAAYAPNGNPWGAFLKVRADTIVWLLGGLDETYESVAKMLSMDPMQVQLIAMTKSEQSRAQRSLP